MFSFAISLLIISVTVIGIGYSISSSVSESIAQLLDESQNISVNVSHYITWKATQQAESLTIIMVLGIVSVGSAIGLMLYATIILGGRRKKMNKLYFDILENKIPGRNEDERCNEMSRRFFEIMKKKGFLEGSDEMERYKILGTIGGIIILVIFGALYYFTNSLQLVFSGMVAIATIAYAVLTAQLVSLNKDIRDRQKKQMDPNINVDFQHEEHNMNLVNLIIENTGKSIAKDVDIKIEPDMDYFQGKKLSDLPIIKNKHDIPANWRRKIFLTNMLDNTEEKTKEPYKISIDFKNEEGKEIHKEVVIDLKMMSGALYSAYSPMIDIRNFLDNINKNFDALTKGFKKLKIVSYTVDEEKQEKKEKIEKGKKIIEELKKKKGK